MRRLWTALAFLTRLPVPSRFAAADIARAAPFFPVVGALVGAAQLIALPLFDAGAPPVVAAILAVGLGTLLTGALHLDGLADTADGFGGGRTREDVLRIMRDHAIGAYGALALLFVVLLKIAAIAALLERPGREALLVAAPAIGRWATVAQSAVLPYARAEGLGAAMAGRVGAVSLAGATLLCAATCAPLGRVAASSWATALIVAAGMGALCRRRIGGVTGDTLGATSELCEAAVLVAGLLSR